MSGQPVLEGFALKLALHLALTCAAAGTCRAATNKPGMIRDQALVGKGWLRWLERVFWWCQAKPRSTKSGFKKQCGACQEHRLLSELPREPSGLRGRFFMCLSSEVGEWW